MDPREHRKPLKFLLICDSIVPSVFRIVSLWRYLYVTYPELSHAPNAFHGPLGGEPGVIYQLLANASHRLNLISISMNQRSPKPDLPWVANCPLETCTEQE